MTREIWFLRMGWQAMLIPSAASPATLDTYTEVSNRCISDSPIVSQKPTELFADPHIDPAFLAMDSGDFVDRSQVHFDKPTFFEAHWPAKNQQPSAHWSDDSPPEQFTPAEKFLIAFDGNVYCVATRCPDPLPRPYSFAFGREARRILWSIFEHDSQVQVTDEPAVGATPMYTAIYICFTDEESPDLGRELIDEFDTLESFYAMGLGGDTQERIKAIMKTLMGPVSAHYSDQELRNHCFDEQEKFELAFSDATSKYSSLVSETGFGPRPELRRRQHSKDMRKAVGECYLRYSALQSYRGQFIQELAKTEQVFEAHPLLNSYRAYPKQMSYRALEPDYNHLLDTVRYLGEESRSRALEAATVQAALVWGFVGGVVVWLLTTVL